jgi:hypothetical protein
MATSNNKKNGKEYIKEILGRYNSNNGEKAIFSLIEKAVVSKTLWML